MKIMHGVSFLLLLIGKSMHLCSAGNNTYPYMSIVNFVTIPLYIGVVFQAEHYIRLSQVHLMKDSTIDNIVLSSADG